ncbi:beta-galactosidase [Deinococcus hopiensis]|uniref:Beta-galactosidase n=1 Tax=Deinococcus hopiensis KR-140 TaxID=695939 RepID=A0A1W1UKD4_9DEIO|nr:beta-galactosidase [Deinococcus hopiensis]SMB81499.1 beta-galactosidase [Deinococcus hopiensis KR-140]
MIQNAHLALGVCDYPEHVPRNRWASYAAQQRALGLSYVRIAEFAWSRMEPRPGEYDWAWLDEAIEVYAAAGLNVVLCTPTAAPPAWLVQQHPDILPHSAGGCPKQFGARRHYDFCSPVFREHSARITRVMAERYGQHPAVVGWQTDNEFGWGDTTHSYSPAAAAGFRAWLQARYGTPEALNEAWGNVFWSMEYTDWAQIGLPNGVVASDPSPSHLLDFFRFSSDMVVEFQEAQVATLRECSPGRWVTHNYMGFFSAFDHYKASACLDFASWDSYPTGTLEALHEWGLGSEDLAVRYARTGHPDVTGFNHDLYRGVTGRPLWVMEQQCGQVNWAPYNPLPADGAVQLWTAQAWAHGADVVSYFRWRAATMAQEVMHSGLLRHDETPDRGHTEVQGLDLSQFPAGDVNARVALLHDYESLWIYNAQKQSAEINYWAQTFLYYRTLRSLGVDVDIVHPDGDLSGYALVVAPALTLVTPERAAHLGEVAQRVPVVFGPRTAFRTPSGRAHEDGQFGPLSGLVGARLLNYDSLRPGMAQRLTGLDGSPHEAARWAEGYRVQDGAVLSQYIGGPLDGQAAAVRRGNVTVIGAHSEGLVREVLTALLEGVGLSPVFLPEGVRLSKRGDVTLVQNWTASPIRWNGLDLPPVGFQVLTPVAEPLPA